VKELIEAGEELARHLKAVHWNKAQQKALSEWEKVSKGAGK